MQNKEFDLRNKVVLEEQILDSVSDIINKNDNHSIGLAEIRSYTANQVIIDTNNSGKLVPKATIVTPTT